MGRMLFPRRRAAEQQCYPALGNAKPSRLNRFPDQHQVNFKGICLAVVAFHLFLTLTVCCRDTFIALSQGNTVLPSGLGSYWKKSANVTTAMLSQRLPKRNLIHQGLGAYLDVTGIEAGYNFFAPHVPGAYKLVFELHYSDGRVEYETPRVQTGAGELRVASLLDQIGWVENIDLRQGLIKSLVYAVWQEHPDVSMVRAIFGTISFPTATDFAHGRKESYRVLYAYDVMQAPNRASTPRQ